VSRTEYRQLQPEERITLASLRQQGHSLRAIAQTLKRSASSLSRELRRNALPTGQGYVAHNAQASSLARRQGKSTRKQRSRTDRRGQILDMVSIHVRPPEVEDRVMPGHWEGDLIKGAKNKSAVGVLVERTTRLVLLIKMKDATAASALEAFSAKLDSIATPLRQTLTYDQGKEIYGRSRALIAGHGTVTTPERQWALKTCGRGVLSPFSGRFARSGRTSSMDRQQFSLGDDEVGQAEQAEQLRLVLVQALVARLPMTEQVLYDMEWMLDLRAHAGLELLGLLEQLRQPPREVLAAFPRLHRHCGPSASLRLPTPR